MKRKPIILFRCISIILIIFLYFILFRLNFPRGEMHPINLTLSVFFTLILLLMSFLYWKSKGYLIFVSIYFGVALISHPLALMLSETTGIIKFLLVIPGMILLTPFSPILSYLPIPNHPVAIIIIILFLYGLIISANRLGEKLMKGGKFDAKS